MFLVSWRLIMAPSVLYIAPIKCFMLLSIWDWHTCRVIGFICWYWSRLAIMCTWYLCSLYLIKWFLVICSCEHRKLPMLQFIYFGFARWKLTLITPHEMHGIEYFTLLRGLYGIPSWFTSMYVFFLELWNSLINYFTVAKEMIVDEFALLSH